MENISKEMNTEKQDGKYEKDRKDRKVILTKFVIYQIGNPEKKMERMGKSQYSS